MSVELWLTRVKEISLISQPIKESSDLLGELFNVDITNPQVSSLQNDILDGSINIDGKVEELDLHEGDWAGFVELVKSYLRFCRDINPDNMVEAFYLYGQFLSDLQTAFSNIRGAVLESTVYRTTKLVVPLSLMLDSQDSQFEMIRTSFLAGVLLKIFNSIRGEKSIGEPLTKKTVILFIATMLCRLYFKLDTPANCASVFSNIHTANIKFSAYSRAQRVEYRYWLGRFYLNKNQLTNSYKHLYWSFQNCLSSSFKSKRSILLYLIPTAILLGKLPRLVLLEAYKLELVYWPLIYSIQKANYSQFMFHLAENESFFHRHKLIVLLQSRSPIILYRMILHRLVTINRKIANDIKSASIVSFQDFQTAAMISMGPFFPSLVDPASDDHMFIEGVAVSLISQGFVKANIYPRMKVIRLKPNNALAPIAEVHHSNELGLTGKEQWMET